MIHLLPELALVVLDYFASLIEGRVERSVPTTISPYCLLSIGEDTLLCGMARQDIEDPEVQNRFEAVPGPTTDGSAYHHLSHMGVVVATSNSHSIYYISDDTRHLRQIDADGELRGVHLEHDFPGIWRLAADDTEVVGLCTTGQLRVLDAKSLALKRERHICSYEKPHLALSSEEIFIACTKTQMVHVLERATLGVLSGWGGVSAGMTRVIRPGQLVRQVQ